MSKNIFVGSLAWGTTSEGIEQAFARYGVVTSAKVISDRETGRSKGFAFVEMETGGDEAIKALNGSDMDGRQIVVNEARPREERSGCGGGGGGGRSGGGGYGGGGGGRGGGGVEKISFRRRERLQREGDAAILEHGHGAANRIGSEGHGLFVRDTGEEIALHR